MFVSDIKLHPWFAKFDWAALLAKKIKPPILPKVKNNTDMSNFAGAEQEEKNACLPAVACFDALSCTSGQDQDSVS